MSSLRPWDNMPGFLLKCMDTLTPASAVQQQLDSLFERYSDFRVWIKDDAAYIDPVRPFRTAADREERFPLSKLRKDQLDALYRIMEKNRQEQH
ncbi:MAG: hypothetical protein IJS14_11120 [Lentisphaeria bacterium]|nr:hypothetical protein [Lentisphaeria bacterium]